MYAKSLVKFVLEMFASEPITVAHATRIPVICGINEVRSVSSGLR